MSRAVTCFRSPSPSSSGEEETDRLQRELEEQDEYCQIVCAERVTVAAAMVPVMMGS